MRTFGSTLVLGVVAFLLHAAPAAAYPQWQFSSGVTRCNVCHYAPAGGGLPTGYGRDATGDELSTFKGEGAFLYGAVSLPSWLAIGGDFRGAYAANDVQEPNGASQAFFPMQADLEVRVAPGLGFSAYATGGMRGQVRPNEDIVPFQNYQPIDDSRFISREHWVMWQQQGGRGWYTRAGRFFAPFGLRLAEHITYVRRDLGFNQLEESYNLSGGYVNDAWELHLTAFAPDFLRQIGGDETGGAAYYEHRVLDEHAGIAVQARFGRGPSLSRMTEGVVGKYYLPVLKTLFLAEADLLQLLPSGVSARQQLVMTGGASVLPAPGLMITVLGERNHHDVMVANDAQDALTALVGWFPYPHAEVQLMGRTQFAEKSATAKTLFLQIHYFL